MNITRADFRDRQGKSRGHPGLPLCLCLALSIAFCAFCDRATAQPSLPRASIANSVLLRIMRAEDERRWDAELQSLLRDQNAEVRRRAVLAAGRIGDEQAVAPLISLLQKDGDKSVRVMAAFALGEIESPAGADALVAALALDQRERPESRARAVEALGKIAAALPKSEEARARPMKEAIVGVLEFEAGRRSAPDDEVVLLGLTAALRARPENVGKVIAHFLGYSDPRVRADTANTLARLKLSDGNEQLRKLLIDDPEPIVRANAARVLGATEDKSSSELLMDRATNDPDLRVRVSAIRALGSLKDAKAASVLTKRAESLLKLLSSGGELPADARNELLDLATVLGRLLSNSNDKDATVVLGSLRRAVHMTAPEVEIALARISPEYYLTTDTRLALDEATKQGPRMSWPTSSFFQALGELATFKSGSEEKTAHFRKEVVTTIGNVSCINYQKGEGCAAVSLSVPDGLRAYAAFKPEGLTDVLRQQFQLWMNPNAPGSKPPKGIYAVKDEYSDYEMPRDVIIRATAAELLGEVPPSKDTTQTLITALPFAFKDELNDATLAILDTLAKQKNATANDAIKTALNSQDHLIRRKAVTLLKANGVGDFTDRIGTVQTRNTTADYQRALARVGKQVRATVTTSKGSFVIEFFPEDAPLTVDNFVMLARKGYFNGQTVPRVVPNFVIQTGDPRGDQNGGPGYSIRCEINQVPYDRGAVGMALSGKDTGGSQWFVTHSPQPHLDGGYTVFGHVVSGMDVVDRIVRGDIIHSVSISESAAPASRRAGPGRMAPKMAGSGKSK